MFFLRLIWVLVHALFAKRADLVAEHLDPSYPSVRVITCGIALGQQTDCAAIAATERPRRP